MILIQTKSVSVVGTLFCLYQSDFRVIGVKLEYKHSHRRQ